MRMGDEKYYKRSILSLSLLQSLLGLQRLATFRGLLSSGFEELKIEKSSNIYWNLPDKGLSLRGWRNKVPLWGQGRGRKPKVLFCWNTNCSISLCVFPLDRNFCCRNFGGIKFPQFLSRAQSKMWRGIKEGRRTGCLKAHKANIYNSKKNTPPNFAPLLSTPSPLAI